MHLFHYSGMIYTSFEELAADYVKGDLHPADLQPALSKALNMILQGGYEKKCADMLPGLKEGQDKMSKSDTSSTIFMEDEEV
ncbi:putative tyrosine--tRNA ligase [Helianthus annuus]|nr:putative tyrosine--tRNA ligase [Helianthus annuus]